VAGGRVVGLNPLDFTGNFLYLVALCLALPILAGLAAYLVDRLAER